MKSGRGKYTGLTSDTRPVRRPRNGARRPCVVVQNDVFNQSVIATSVVCLITSNLSRANAPGNVLLKKGEASLAKASVVNVSQILTVDKAELVDCTGKLSGTAARAVCDGLHLLLDRF